MTVLDLITRALKRIAVLAQSESPTAQDASDAMTTLNQLVDQWAAEKLLIYTTTRTTWTISANDGEYTVGSGANVNVARPVYLDKVNYIDTATDPDSEYKLNMLTESAYASITQKAQTSTAPTAWYYNPTFPNGTLTLWPIPTSSTLQGALYAPAAVSQFSSLSTSISLPPGYERMLETNLALELAPEYERTPHQVLVQAAIDSKAAVVRSNHRLRDMSFERSAGALSGRYNVYTDT